MTGPGGWCSPTQRGTSSVSDGVLLSGRQVRTNLSQLATSPVAQRDALYRYTARAVASVRCPRSSSGEVLSLRELPGNVGWIPLPKCALCGRSVCCYAQDSAYLFSVAHM